MRLEHIITKEDLKRSKKLNSLERKHYQIVLRVFLDTLMTYGKAVGDCGHLIHNAPDFYQTSDGEWRVRCQVCRDIDAGRERE